MTEDHVDHNSTDARLKRIETALYLLCRHLGLDPRTGDRLTDHAPSPTAPPRAHK